MSSYGVVTEIGGLRNHKGYALMRISIRRCPI